MSPRAQMDGGGSTRRLRLWRGRAAAFVLAIGTAVAAQAQPASFQLALHALQAGDCKRAGDLINDGIERRVPSLLYIAGLMVELGLCTDANPAAAAALYETAAQPGDALAARRLARELAEGGAFPRSYRRAAAFMQHWASLRRMGEARPQLALPLLAGTSDTWQDYWLLVTASLQTMETIDYPESAIQARAETRFLIDLCSPYTAPTITRDPSAASVSPQVEADFKSALLKGLERTYRVLPPPKLDTVPPCTRVSMTFFIDWKNRPRP
jgi:hypothetical protein